MEGIDKVAKRLQEERGKVADIIRQEFADRYVAVALVIDMYIELSPNEWCLSATQEINATALYLHPCNSDTMCIHEMEYSCQQKENI